MTAIASKMDYSTFNNLYRCTLVKIPMIFYSGVSQGTYMVGEKCIVVKDIEIPSERESRVQRIFDLMLNASKLLLEKTIPAHMKQIILKYKNEEQQNELLRKIVSEFTKQLVDQVDSQDKDFLDNYGFNEHVKVIESKPIDSNDKKQN